VIERWVALWDRREAPQSLALVRILFVGALLVDLLSSGAHGAVFLLWAPPPLGAAFGGVEVPSPLLTAWFGSSATTAVLLWAAAVLASALVVCGVAYRFTSSVLVVAMIALAENQPVGDGIDQLIYIVLPLLACSRADACWSFDAWYRARRGRPPETAIPAWPRYLLFVQLVWLYFSVARHRNATWGPLGGFSAVGNVLGDPHFARFAPGTLALLDPLLRVSTVCTMIFEVSAPLAPLWTWLDRRPSRGGRLGDFVRRARLRWAWLALGASLHLGIAVTMRLGIFPFAMLALYPALLFPDEIARGVARLSAFAASVSTKDPVSN
jgi:Vitamin K-dependent gamma-carboxylase